MNVKHLLGKFVLVFCFVALSLDTKAIIVCNKSGKRLDIGRNLSSTYFTKVPNNSCVELMGVGIKVEWRISGTSNRWRRDLSDYYQNLIIYKNGFSTQIENGKKVHEQHKLNLNGKTIEKKRYSEEDFRKKIDVLYPFKKIDVVLEFESKFK